MFRSRKGNKKNRIRQLCIGISNNINKYTKNNEDVTVINYTSLDINKNMTGVVESKNGQSKVSVRFENLMKYKVKTVEEAWRVQQKGSVTVQRFRAMLKFMNTNQREYTSLVNNSKKIMTSSLLLLEDPNSNNSQIGLIRSYCSIVYEYLSEHENLLEVII